jgi:NAD(P)-dependent dehydrogenase (short-subunit alcohol dehydrogenase family)
MLLQDRAALITGGAGRLGKVIAAILRREGAAVAIADSNTDRITDVLPGLQHTPGPRVVGLRTDVTDPAAVAQVIADAKAAIGRIDVLVNYGDSQRVSRDVMSLAGSSAGPADVVTRPINRQPQSQSTRSNLSQRRPWAAETPARATDRSGGRQNNPHRRSPHAL